MHKLYSETSAQSREVTSHVSQTGERTEHEAQREAVIHIAYCINECWVPEEVNYDLEPLKINWKQKIKEFG